MSKADQGEHTLDYALHVAARVVEALRPFAERIEVAGSIRRKREMVHDIDIVMLPKRTPSGQKGLFDDAPAGSPETSTQEIERTLELKVTPALKKLAYRNEMEADGPKIKKCLMLKGKDATGKPELIKIDLYITYLVEWWPTLLLIRTGSAQHNEMLATVAKARGWTLHASGEGLFDRNHQLLANESEEAIFKALDRAYKPPEEREVHVTRTKKARSETPPTD
jgi:DNA polymerase/3'-5' exonuclease PolX